MKYFCSYCGREFELSAGQLKMYKTAHKTIFYCSEECRKIVSRQGCRERYYKRVEKNRDAVNEYARKKYNKNKVRVSERSCSKDLSPNQLGYEDLSPSEKQSIINKLSSAQAKAYKTNKHSKRRGVQFVVRLDKKTGVEYSYWRVEKQINNIMYRKWCHSEEEAIAYVEELENKYFDQDQLNIRNKSLKSMNIKENK